MTQDKVINSLQSIHLHCFNGDEATVKLWSDAYPGTYFGFSSMVKGFGDRQRRGLKAAPGNRLLLESDTPISLLLLEGLAFGHICLYKAIIR